MLSDKNSKGDQNNFIKTIAIILAIAISTFYIMIWISPESKNVGKFLLGFGMAFVGIVLCAYFIRYINDIYKQIKSKK
jgi:FtsH-binding integral membrane protein